MTGDTGGDGDGDDMAAESLPNYGTGGFWTPECWHKSPDQLIAEAKASNAAGYSEAFSNAGKHSNPPAWNAGRSL